MAFKLPFKWPQKSPQGFVKRTDGTPKEVHTLSIPWFSNQFHLGNNWILKYHIKESASFIKKKIFPRQSTGQIKTKSIDMHFSNPIAQAVHD